MPKKSARKAGKAKPFWERGYQSHGYWQGKERLGTVQLGERGQRDGIYRWQAGTRAGETKTLAEAKRAVELTLEFGASQLGLFDSGEPD
jgi:hypothetical protein